MINENLNLSAKFCLKLRRYDLVIRASERSVFPNMAMNMRTSTYVVIHPEM
jgi:hypothetical protein